MSTPGQGLIPAAPGTAGQESAVGRGQRRRNRDPPRQAFFIEHEKDAIGIVGAAGSIRVTSDDEIAWKLAMLVEGECESETPSKVAETYGYCRQRYHQVLAAFRSGGAAALVSGKRGPKTQYRRGGEVARQVIRYRYLDPDASAGVIAQKLRQDGWEISIRSVFRVFAEFGLQKRTSTSAGRARTCSPRRR